LGVIEPVILDSGPLVAMLDRREACHEWTVERLKELPLREFITCEAVIAETFFSMAKLPAALKQVNRYVEDGSIRIEFGLQKEWGKVASIMEAYRDQGVSLADACLVRMSEIRPDSKVWTLDRNFRLYRRNGKERIPLIIPERE
jgi:uncharacterized protein